MQKPRRSHRNDLGSVFAASVVTVLGAGISSTLFAVGSPESSSWVVALIIAPSTLFLAVLVGVRWPKMGTGLDFWHVVFRCRADDARGVDYQPRRIRQKLNRVTGRQQPITVHEMRQIQLLSNNIWVPSRRHRKQPDPDESQSGLLGK